MRIRQATLADLDTLVNFQQQMALETEQLHLESDVLRKGITALINDAHKGVYYVAEEKGELLACLSLT